MNLTELLKQENIFLADSFETTDDFYAAFAEFLAEKKIIADKEGIKRLFVKRETVHSTAIGKGAAAPHIFSSEFSEFLFTVARIKDGMDFKAADEEKVFLVFLIMSGEREVGKHLKTLAHIARLIKSTDAVEKIKQAADADAIFNALKESENLI